MDSTSMTYKEVCQKVVDGQASIVKWPNGGNEAVVTFHNPPVLGGDHTMRVVLANMRPFAPPPIKWN